MYTLPSGKRVDGFVVTLAVIIMELFCYNGFNYVKNGQ